MVGSVGVKALFRLTIIKITSFEEVCECVSNYTPSDGVEPFLSFDPCSGCRARPGSGLEGAGTPSTPVVTPVEGRAGGARE